MATSQSFPYETHLDIKYQQMELIDLPALISTVKHPWFNQSLCLVNDSVVRIGVLQGEYHWHKHDKEDEFFFVLSGKFVIEMRDRTVELGPQQGYVVPKGVEHCPRAPEKTVVLMVESAGIIPTGD
jgi:mannose-6-phosphate isomerase-like protein (cupin superfamily)